MKKIPLQPIIKSVGSVLEKHAPEFLVSVGIVGMFTATVLAVKATPDAVSDIAEIREDKIDAGEDLTRIDCVKAAWKHYIPAAATAVGSAVCIIAGTTVSIRRGTAMATAYKLSQEALKEYREATVDTVGKDKELEIRERVSENKAKLTPVNDSNVFMTGKGSELCYEPLSGRYFWSSRNAIEHDFNLFNSALMGDNEKTLNDLYSFLGLKEVDENVGGILGWKFYGDKMRDLVYISFKSVLSEDGHSALAIVYDNPPKYYDPRVYYRSI